MNHIQDNRNKLFNLINNKKVVLVGPAPYLNKKNHGSYIDKYDIVIRCNKGHGLIRDPNSYGSRTDILYHCVSQSQDDGGIITEELYNNVELIVLAYPSLTSNDKSTFANGNIDLYKQINSNFY